MSKVTESTKRLLCVIACFYLAGCSTISSWWGGDIQPEQQLIVKIKAAENINPNLRGQATPVQLRVYQLADIEVFRQADFIQLFRDEQGVLKADLLSTRHLESVLPGEERKEVFPLKAGVKYIGVIAGFADYREAKNKAFVQPIIVGSTIVSIEVDGVNLSILGEK